MKQNSDMLQIYPESVLSHGFGIVGKRVMCDPDLKVTAKAIYAYICTYSNFSSGNGEYQQAWPGLKRICADLKINRDTYHKHLSQLIDLGYISVSQIRENGQFQHNVFTINITPQPKRKNSAAVNSAGKSPEPNFSAPVKSTPEKSVPKNRATNNTSINNTSDNITTTEQDQRNETREVVVALGELGAKNSVACQLIAEYGIEAVKQRLEQVKTKDDVRNAMGWIVDALRKDYSEVASIGVPENRKLQPSPASQTIDTAYTKTAPLAQESADYINQVQHDMVVSHKPQGIFAKIHREVM